MADRYYRRASRRGVGPTVLVAALVLFATACKKNRDQPFEGDEKGKLRRIAENLEEAYASAALPPLSEPVSLAERVEKWDDFRSCTVRTYVARKRDADRRIREGRERRQRHNSIGEEAVEECAVQLAVAKKDRLVCDRLAAEYVGPNGELPLSAARCWDTRARVFGLPDECPVLWLGEGQFGRNPECLAAARRDQSLCPFAESPGRCRAILTSDMSQCSGKDGAPDCTLAVDYWRGLIPAGFGQPLLDPIALGKNPPFSKFDLRWQNDEHPRLRVDGPEYAAVLSWPTSKDKPGYPGQAAKFWGWTPPPEAVQVSWSEGEPAMKLVFAAASAAGGSLPLEAPGPATRATLIVAFAENPNKFLRCQPGAETSGDVRWNAGAVQPGAFVDGEVNARRLTCTDGTFLDVQGKFRLLILDLR